MFATWEELIRGSLIEIGVKEPGETLDADERSDAFTILKLMFEEWGLEGLLIPGLQRVFHTFTTADAGRMDYSMGPDQTDDEDDPDIITTARIEEVDSFNYRRSGDEQSYPIDATSYAVLSSLRRAYRYRPTKYYFDQGHPFTTIYFNARTLAGDQIEVAGSGHFHSTFAVSDDPAVLLPPGYQEGVRLNLAVKLAPSYGVKEGRSQGLGQETRRAARAAKSRMKARNLQVVDARIDPALRSFGSSSQLLRRRDYTE